MTIKFLKEWGQHLDGNLEFREEVQRGLDGGGKITRYSEVVEVDVCGVAHVYVLENPGRAVKFAAALNKLRRPLHLLKQDLDADWARRVKERDDCTCVGCGVKGDKIGATIPAHTELDEFTGEEIREVKERIKKDVLTAHHWIKTKSRSGMARWARPNGITYHYAEHIHTLHENPCWVDLKPIYDHVARLEGEDAIRATITLASVPATEARVRAAWLAIPVEKKDAP
jgi:hypothetical protein